LLIGDNDLSCKCSVHGAFIVGHTPDKNNEEAVCPIRDDAQRIPYTYAVNRAAYTA